MPILNSNQYAIAFHTSTAELGIAINNYQGDYRSQVWDLGRDLASALHSSLAKIIYPQTWQDIAWLAVAKGPGGFTGTRVGVVTARTIAQQLDIPLFGISNLAAVAAAQNYQGEELLAVEMDARREQLYVAIYQIDKLNHLQIYLEDTLMTQQGWQETLNKLDLPYRLIKAEGSIASTVTNVLDLAYVSWRSGQSPHWSKVVPFYGQHPVNQ